MDHGGTPGVRIYLRHCCIYFGVSAKTIMLVEPGWLTPLAQYTAPMILIMQLCLLYKTLGGGSWTGGLVPGPGAGQEVRSQEAGDEFQAG